jgi:hypothetical protein
LYTNKKSK